MQFSNTENDSGILQECEFLCNLGTTGISGNAQRLQDFTRLVNSRYHQVVTMILRSQNSWDYDDINHTDFPILTTNLVADQPDYSLPASEKILKLKRIEVTYDGTNYYKAEPLDIGQVGEATDTTSISSDFDDSKPFYDIQYNSIFLYPIPDTDVTRGLKLWVTREVDEFTSSDTTQEPGIDEPFHRMLAIGASMDWAIAKGLGVKNDLMALYQDYERRLGDYYGSKQTDKDMRFSSSFINYN